MAYCDKYLFLIPAIILYHSVKFRQVHHNMIHNIIKDKATRLFLILGGFFIANALIAEIIGVKIFSLERAVGAEPMNIHLFGNELSLNLTAGVLLWPVVFIMTD